MDNLSALMNIDYAFIGDLAVRNGISIFTDFPTLMNDF